MQWSGGRELGRATGEDGSVPVVLDDEYLTVDEVAATLRLVPQTIRNWIDAGTLPAVRIGRRVRIKRSDFDQLVEQRYVSRPAPPPPSIWDGDVPYPELR